MKYLVFGAIAFLAVMIFQYLAKGRTMSDKNTVKEMIDRGALILDVRSPGEFSGGHYPKAINIPVDSLGGRMGELGAKDREIVVYCLSGGRSSRAKQMLEAAGYTKVINGGGIGDMPK
jgi:phage shock protein E